MGVGEETKKWRVLILYSHLFLSLSTLSCLPMCALFNCSFSRRYEPHLNLQDTTAYAQITNGFLNLPHVSHLLKTRPAHAYPHNFTQYFIWHIGFFIWGSKADSFWSPVHRKRLLFQWFQFSVTSFWRTMSLLHISLTIPYTLYDSFSYYLSVLGFYVLIVYQLHLFICGLTNFNDSQHQVLNPFYSYLKVTYGHLLVCTSSLT